ncbi:MAG: type II toxin-antitoxin system RelE family toxin [Lachnospiraceae bacterium]
MSEWKIIYSDEALQDLLNLGGQQQRLIARAIKKVSGNPLPKTEGGCGIPLGNKNPHGLTRCLEVRSGKAGLRAVYTLQRTEMEQDIIVIAIRSDDQASDTALNRTRTQ